ncbi:MAG TPA: hypothetical protein VME46_04655, partial [Acidimicrobiales bacterium]|nr:hypothetical protein [Acidimicrobiales bacterium]
ACAVLGAASMLATGPVLAAGAAPDRQGPARSGPGLQLQAEILPAATFAVGSSLSGGPGGDAYGIGLTSNDISNSWTTCARRCTLDFVFFVFTNEDETAQVQFRVLSPADKPLYQYTWSSHLVQTNWYAAYAKGDYSATGTYFAEVYVAGKLEGWVPMTFNKPK